jgi:hypothetical protein
MNIEAMVVDNQYYATQQLAQADVEQLSQDAKQVYVNQGTDVLTDEESEEQKAAIRLDCVAQEAGDYYVQMGEYYAPVGYLEEGETFYLYYEVDSEFLEAEVGLTGMIQFYMVDEAQWQKAYEILSEQQLQVTDYSSDVVEGEIEVQQDGILFTSIPYDDNWVLYVDGVQTEILPLWDNHFVAVKLPEGTHDIRLEYHQRGLLAGTLMSVVVFAGVAVVCVIEKRRKRYHSSEEV